MSCFVVRQVSRIIHAFVRMWLKTVRREELHIHKEAYSVYRETGFKLTIQFVLSLQPEELVVCSVFF